MHRLGCRPVTSPPSPSTNAGVTVESASQDGITRGIYVRDSNNNCVELFCNRGDNGLEAIRTTDLNPEPLDLAPTAARQQ